ncbi:MAG: hypothetical protein ABL857_06540 [Rickettsiales bacterium]
MAENEVKGMSLGDLAKLANFKHSFKDGLFTAEALRDKLELIKGTEAGADGIITKQEFLKTLDTLTNCNPLLATTDKQKSVINDWLNTSVGEAGVNIDAILKNINSDLDKENKKPIGLIDLNRDGLLSRVELEIVAPQVMDTLVKLKNGEGPAR